MDKLGFQPVERGGAPLRHESDNGHVYGIRVDFFDSTADEMHRSA
jgi:hypothetical protein